MTDDEQRELLQRFRLWLRKTAYTMLRTDEKRFTEDLAQEGWIAIWEECGNNRDVPWLMAVARNRMRNVVRYWHAQKRDENRYVWVDDIREYWEDTDSYEDVELAYHHGDIARAVNELPQPLRGYVLRRFWHNWSPSALEIQYDWPRQTIWPKCKAQLRERLDYLR